MYEPYWKLNGHPFRNDYEARFFHRSRTHQAALLKMRYLVEHDQGAGVLAGGSGLGKTYLTHVLAHELPEPYGPVVRLVYPQLAAEELLAYVAAELGADEADLPSNGSRTDLTLRHIERRLAAYGSDGRHPVLIIDDAHLIEDPRVFHALHLLLNFQHHKSQIRFSLILVGEPVLLGRLARFGPLNDRLAIKSVLQPLSEDEAAAYVRHRLQTAGAETEIFDESALRELHAASDGVPRRINRLCDLALLVGFADKLSILSGPQIEAVAEEVLAVVPD